MDNSLSALNTAKAALEAANASVTAAQSDVQRAAQIVDEAILALQPQPENPRPLTPENIQVTAREDGSVLMSWDPLPSETPGVQIHRETRNGWRLLTSEATEYFVDTPEAGPHTYRLRGYGLKIDGTPHASPWAPYESVDTTSEPVEPVEPELTALSRVNSGVEANKDWRLPVLKGSRRTRENIGAIGDVKRGTWTEGDLIKQDLNSVVPKGYAQWSSNLHKDMGERPGTYSWINVGVAGAEDATQLKWGTREFNAPFRQFIDCDFAEIDKEHGLYVSNNAGTWVDGCTFLRCGSQGVQFAHRPLPYQQYDGDNEPYRAKPHHLLKDCHFVDCAYKGIRPSFNATYFNPGTSEMPGTLTVEDCSFVCNWPEPKFYNGRELRSTGALVTGNMQGNEPLSGHPMMERVSLRNTLFDFTKTDRSVVSLRSCEEIVIEDCAFILRDCTHPALSVDKYIDSADIKTQTITIRNTHVEGGNALIFLTDGSKKYVDIHCPGEEIVISGLTGTVVSRTSL